MKTEHKKLLRDAYALSMLNLAMGFTTLTDKYAQYTESELGPEIEDRIRRTNELIRRRMEHEEVSAEDAEALRRENTADMEILSALTDVYLTDEYILVRMEGRFDNSADMLPEDGDLTDRLIGYFSRVPKELQSTAINSVIEQLPFRLTKNRFLELIRERLGIYRGGSLSAFMEKLEMLNTAAGISERDLFGSIAFESDRVLSSTDISVETAEELQAVTDALEASGRILSARTDIVGDLQYVLNCLEVVLLTDAYSAGFELEDEICGIVLRLHDAIASGHDQAAYSVYPDLEVLEGKPEALSEALAGLYPGDYGEPVLNQVSVLMSSSLFTLLDDKEEDETLTEELFRKEFRTFSENLLTRLNSVNRTYARALMGRMNAVLPPRFTSQEEVENYILGSLSGCSNSAEKAGAARMLQEIMEEGQS